MLQRTGEHTLWAWILSLLFNWVTDQECDRNAQMPVGTGFPMIGIATKLICYRTQFIWAITPKYGHDAVPEQDRWSQRDDVCQHESRPTEWAQKGVKKKTQAGNIKACANANQSR